MGMMHAGDVRMCVHVHAQSPMSVHARAYTRMRMPPLSGTRAQQWTHASFEGITLPKADTHIQKHTQRREQALAHRAPTLPRPAPPRPLHLKICSLPLTSGASTLIWRLNLPGRRSALSRMSARLVLPSTCAAIQPSSRPQRMANY